MLATRARTALIALVVFLAALFYLPKAGWALFLMLWLLIGAWEWAGLAKWSGAARFAFLASVSAFAVALWTMVIVPADARAANLLYALSALFWLLVAPLWLARGWRVTHPLPLALAGIVVVLPLWVALVQLQVWPKMLLMLMAILWISDTAAYLSGKQWGRRKLARSISPGKTWEGVAGALVAVTLYYGIISVTASAEHSALQGVTGLAIFLVLTVLGVEGDLFESWVKRTAGAKDSGTLLPGHGGILDRVDALTSSMPAAALLLAWFA